MDYNLVGSSDPSSKKRWDFFMDNMVNFKEDIKPNIMMSSGWICVTNILSQPEIVYACNKGYHIPATNEIIMIVSLNDYG